MNKIIMNFLARNESIKYGYTACCLKHGIDTDVGSNHIKYLIYNLAYPMEFRPKKTGFEKIDNLDKIAREKLRYIVDKQENDAEFVESGALASFLESDLDELGLEELIKKYKNSLEDAAELCREENNILYLSGGIDSELMARVFLSKKINFVHIIFVFTNNNHEILNDFDTNWAFKFCKDSNLNPLTRSINVEAFWASNELLDIALHYNCASPQLCTHYKMTGLVHREIDNNGWTKFVKKTYRSYVT